MTTADPWNNGDPRYGTRFFNARIGEVALTCCKRCGAIVWNTALHERTNHADEQDTDEATDEEDTGQEGTGQLSVEISSAQGGLAATDGDSGGDAAAGRREQSGVGGRAGRATAAGSGKRQGR